MLTRIALTIDTRNAAFEDAPFVEVARIMRDVARDLQAYEVAAPHAYRDANGNTVARLVMHDDGDRPHHVHTRIGDSAISKLGSLSAGAAPFPVPVAGVDGADTLAASFRVEQWQAVRAAVAAIPAALENLRAALDPLGALQSVEHVAEDPAAVDLLGAVDEAVSGADDALSEALARLRRAWA